MREKDDDDVQNDEDDGERKWEMMLKREGGFDVGGDERERGRDGGGMREKWKFQREKGVCINGGGGGGRR